jgi:hypothetical protein
MTSQAAAAYAQLLSLGVVWVGMHCVGMCGPLLLGVGLGRRGPGSGPAGLLLYQAGRATLYAPLGALSGWAGRVLSERLAAYGPLWGLALGALLLAAPLWERALARASASPPRSLQGGLRWLTSPGASGWSRPYLLGVLMAGLPCMIVVWALTLAASTGSPVHGAGVMLLLLALNSLPLLGVVSLPRLLGARSTWLLRAQPWLTRISGVWLLLAASAASGWIAHRFIQVPLAGRHYMLMFW